MAKNRRGGYRQPKKPAAVATPQGGQRTDGGQGSAKQPIRRLPNADYGANKRFEGGQEAVDGLPAVKPIPMPQQGTGNNLQNSLYGPTERKMESPTAGGLLDYNSDGLIDEMVQDDVDILLEEMGRRNPDNLYLQQLRSTRETQSYR